MIISPPKEWKKKRAGKDMKNACTAEFILKKTLNQDAEEQT